MAEFAKAFVIGGWSEDKAFVEPLANELDSGPHRIVNEAEPVTLGWALKNIDDLNLESPRRIVVMHSSAKMAIRQAGVGVVLNGAEPTPYLRTIGRGAKVAFNKKIGREDHVPEPGITNAAVEVLLRNPSTLAVPWRVRKFSSLNGLIDEGQAAYPGGRIYLPTDRDEFKFGHSGEVEKAQAFDIYAEMLPGFHNQPMLHPRAHAAHIERILNEIN